MLNTEVSTQAYRNWMRVMGLSSMEYPLMTSAKYSDFLTPPPCLHFDLIYILQTSRNFPYNIRFSMTPSPSDVDIISGSSLCSFTEESITADGRSGSSTTLRFTPLHKPLFPWRPPPPQTSIQRSGRKSPFR